MAEIKSKNAAVAVTPKKEETALTDVGQKITTYLLEQTQSFARIEGTELTGEEKIFAVNTICDIDKKLREQGIDWKQVDVIGCKVPQQIKRYARLGLSTSDGEIYVDVRYNSKTGKNDVTIKKQYQGVEKEIIKFCSKKIDHFKRGVICVGDEFEIEEDFETGYDKVTKHKKNPDKNLDRNLLDNIVGAYEIAYEKLPDGSFVQHVALIDKNRIMRAYNASPSREKTVWKNDTQRMVLKTAAWVLYNNVLKPYIEIPTSLKKDWEETNDQMEFESLNAESQEQQYIIHQNVGEGDIVAFDDEAEATN
jgi:hypothetical protein